MVETQSTTFKAEFDTVQEALNDFGKWPCWDCLCYLTKTWVDIFSNVAANKFVIVMDNEDRENEGDLIIAAEKITTEQMAFLIRYSR